MISQSILLYLFKMILVAGIFYGYYCFLLRDKKFHQYNRFFLLSASLLSIIIPALQLNWFTIQKDQTTSSNALIGFVIDKSSLVIQSKSIFTVATIILILLLIGAVFLLFKLTHNLYKIQRLKKIGEVVIMEGFDFIYTEEDKAPFSFLNNLFWKKTISIETESGQQIFKHELTHIREKHTWDRLYCQLVACIFWMNPFNWLIQKELETIHEFIADEAAVGTNNTEAFAKMLLQTHYGHHFLNPTHTFFYASIKRRIAMLSNTKYSKFNYVRKLMGIPILLFVLILFAVKLKAEERVKVVLQQFDKVILVEPKLDTMPKGKILKNKQKKNTNASLSNLSTLAILDGAFVSVDIINNLNPKKIKSLNVLDTKHAMEKYGQIGKYGAIEVVSQPEMKQIVMIQNQEDVKQIKPLYVLNGVAIESLQFDSLKLSDIKAIHIRKDEEEKQKFGEKGKNGIIYITTKW